MKGDRSQNQRRADDFDAKLYRLMSIADGAAVHRHTNSDSCRRWREIHNMLAPIRRRVRDMMHPADRKETEG